MSNRIINIGNAETFPTFGKFPFWTMVNSNKNLLLILFIVRRVHTRYALFFFIC